MHVPQICRVFSDPVTDVERVLASEITDDDKTTEGNSKPKPVTGLVELIWLLRFWQDH